MAKNGLAKVEILILKPKTATIQAVDVVPIFAPIMTLMAFCKLIRPPPINAEVNNVTKVLDCNIPVVNVPVNIPFIGVLVKFFKNFRNDLPANPFMPFSRWYIPKRKIPKPAIKSQKSKWMFVVKICR